MGRIPKKDIRVKYRKILKILGYIVLTPIILFLLSILPDVLYFVRVNLKECSFFGNFFKNEINNSQYIEMVTALLANCVAIIVSIMVYHITKKTGTMQSRQYKEIIISAAVSLKTNIEKNSYILYEIKAGKENIDNLKFDEALREHVICLYSAGQIDKKEREICESYCHKVSAIINFHKEAKDRERDETIKEFCDEFFVKDSDAMQYNKEMRSFLYDRLEKIVEGNEYV
jgi:hypothetical protein